MESLFNKVEGLKVCNFLKNRLQHRILQIFKNRFLIEQLRWLLLTVLPRYCKFSLGACSLNFTPPRAFNFDQKVSGKVAQIICNYYVTKQFLGCLNCLVTCLRFQNLFWKNISCFRFRLNIYTKRCISNYVMSKDFLSLHFAVSQVLPISVYDLKNGRMTCKQKYGIKNMVVKIATFILFRLVCLLS